MHNDYESLYISPWGYVGYGVLWSIPVIGWIIWAFSCFSKKTNKRNYARSFVCFLVFFVVLSTVLNVALFLLLMFGLPPEIVESIEEGYFQTIL